MFVGDVKVSSCQGWDSNPIEFLFPLKRTCKQISILVSCEDGVLYKFLVPSFGSGDVWFFGLVFFSSCVGMGKAAFFLIGYVGWVG
jgi:hypothetical protein